MYNLNIFARCMTRSASSMRTISSTNIARLYFPKIGEKPRDNTSVIKDAERVVGYPASFLSLRLILNDEMANVTTHIRKLIGTDHPLLQVAKSLLLRSEQATWGLVVLLISKVAGLNSKFSDGSADILHGQRVIAEVIEMIRTSHLMHKGIINVNVSTPNRSDMNLGNGVSLLFGDYLLSTGSAEIARLKNNHLYEVVVSSLRDFAESEFIGMRDSQNRPIPSKPLPVQQEIDIPPEFGSEPFPLAHVLGNMKAEWTLRNVLSGASLLAKGCQGALILANHAPEIQKLGYIFGRGLALAWQLSLEKDLINEETFSLASAPVMFHLEHDPSFYAEIEKLMICENDVDYDFVRKVVKGGPGLEKTLELQNTFASAALNALENFADSDSKTALTNLTMAL